MRVIKFRAKHKLTGEWHYFRLVDLFGLKDRLRYSHWTQFTGGKDKHGREIYDGDILQTVMKLEGILVFWRVFWGEANTHNDHINTWCVETERDTYWLDQGLQEQGEVIGNIYDNPDLASNTQRVLS